MLLRFNFRVELDKEETQLENILKQHKLLNQTIILNLTNLILLIKYLTISQRTLTYKLKTLNLPNSHKIAQTHINLNYGSFLNPTKLLTTQTIFCPSPTSLSPSRSLSPLTRHIPKRQTHRPTLLSHWLPNSRAHSRTLTCTPHDSRSLIALLTITTS